MKFGLLVLAFLQIIGFIPEQHKKRYYSAMNTDNMSIQGSEIPEFCLEIDSNEEIFIPNVYDMLLIHNYLDDLSMRSFRICLRPPGYAGKSSNNLEKINKNLEDNMIESKIKIENKIGENKQDKDNLKDFNNHQNENLNEVKIDANIYEDIDDNIEKNGFRRLKKAC